MAFFPFTNVECLILFAMHKPTSPIIFVYIQIAKRKCWELTKTAGVTFIKMKKEDPKEWIIFNLQ